MTKHFRNYVNQVLKDNGIVENEKFVSSHQEIGILKWESGTMYEDDGDALGVEDIAFVLEESDIKPLYEFKQINQLEAMIELESESNKIYRKICGEFKRVALTPGKNKIQTINNFGYEEVNLIEFLNMQFYKLVRNDN